MPAFDAGPLGGFGARKTRALWVPGFAPFAGSAAYIPFTFPRHASAVFMVAVGGGASGGLGQSAAASTAAGGGGGGGCGAMGKLLIATAFLPRTIYLSAGLGGVGAVGAQHTSGKSVIATSADGTNLILASGPNSQGASQGNDGAGGTGGTGGNSEQSASNQTQAFTGLGLWSAVGGPNGAAGGTGGAAGGAISAPNTSNPFSPGAGGGSTDATTTQGAGGAINGTGFVPTANGGPTSGGIGTAGLNQIVAGNCSLIAEICDQLFAATGGSGGGANIGTSVAGGAGGAGGWGCGGGGGGGCSGTTSSGGVGGNGGPGFILLVWW